MPKYLPGQRDGRTTSPRNVLLSQKNLRRVEGGGVIDATYAIDGANTGKTQELRAGCLMARITASKLWVPLKLTQISDGTSGSGSGNSATAITVEDARFFKAGDAVLVESDDSGGDVTTTIASIDYTNNVITLDDAVEFARNGGAVKATGVLAGAEIARAVLNEFVDLIDHDDNTARDRHVSELLINAYVDEGKILGDLAAVRAPDNFSTAITHYLDQIQWGDQTGVD